MLKKRKRKTLEAGGQARQAGQAERVCWAGLQGSGHTGRSACLDVAPTPGPVPAGTPGRDSGAPWWPTCVITCTRGHNGVYTVRSNCLLLGRKAMANLGSILKSRNITLPEKVCLVKARRRQWHPTPVFLPGESQGRWSWVSCRLWGCTESDTIEVMQQSRLCFFQ